METGPIRDWNSDLLLADGVPSQQVRQNGRRARRRRSARAEKSAHQLAAKRADLACRRTEISWLNATNRGLCKSRVLVFQTPDLYSFTSSKGEAAARPVKSKWAF